MPFDGLEMPFNYLEKFDQVIELMEMPGRWVKRTYRTPKGRYCLKEMLSVVGIAEVFEPIILNAAEEVTGRQFCCVESFNDHPQTVRADVVAVLRQSRANVLMGKALLPGVDAPSGVRLNEPIAAGRRAWTGALWQRLFAWS